jgi:hypothetical protein
MIMAVRDLESWWEYALAEEQSNHDSEKPTYSSIQALPVPEIIA